MSGRNGLLLRPFTSADLQDVLVLFRNSVHSVNAADYTPRQLEAWAPERPDNERWRERMERSASFVVEKDGTIVGFGNIEKNGLIDTLYVGPRAQKNGVGAAILTRLIADARTRQHASVFTEASITARPFFEQHGFVVEKEQLKSHNGEMFKTFLMTKKIEDGEEEGETD